MWIYPKCGIGVRSINISGPIRPSLVPTCSRVAAPPEVQKPFTYRAPPRPVAPSAWHVGPVAKVTHRSWWPPRGTGDVLVAWVAMPMEKGE